MATSEEPLTVAVRHHQAGQYAEARQIYRQLLAEQPDNPQVLSLMGAVCIQFDELSEAARHLQRALQIDPKHRAAHDNLGVLYSRQQRLDDAVVCFRRAIEVDPRYAPSYVNLANAQLKQGQTEEAIDSLRRAVRVAPEAVRAHALLARILSDSNRAHEALPHCAQVARLTPQDPKAHLDLAEAAMRCGQVAQAEASYREHLRLRPDHAEAHAAIATPLVARKANVEAETHARRAVELKPDCLLGWLNLGLALTKQRKFEEAKHAIEQARRLKPDSPDAANNLGMVYSESGEFDLAESTLRRALALKPNDVDVMYNLGKTLIKQKKLAEALNFSERVLDLQPLDAEAHFNRGVVMLLREDLVEGFTEYRWRFLTSDFKVLPFRWPQWSGVPLEGRTIVLCHEQGIGDTFQFIRYAQSIKQLGAKVIFECAPLLHRILERTPGIDEWTSWTEPAPRADFCVSLMNLPHQLQTTVANIPRQIPYIFAAPELIEVWKQRLASAPGFRVGIAWQGNAELPDDPFRSMPLARFAPLADVPGVRLINLQKGFGSEQLPPLAERLKIVDYGEQLDAVSGPFMDTAAIMKNLDLVITSDTSIAHLAGGLGVPVWVALGYVAEWRWMLDREDSPWYPTMRLFRQSKWHDWESVFARMADELAPLAAARR